jgi:hypothetical protein
MASYNTVAADSELKDDLLSEGDRMLGIGFVDNSESSFLFPRYALPLTLLIILFF